MPIVFLSYVSEVTGTLRVRIRAGSTIDIDTVRIFPEHILYKLLLGSGLHTRDQVLRTGQFYFSCGEQDLNLLGINYINDYRLKYIWENAHRRQTCAHTLVCR